MIKKCIGCGSILQTLDKNGLGYIPNIKNEYCMRCFRLKNYGEKKENESINEGEIISKVNNSQKGIVFFLIDYLNLNNYTLNIFKQIKKAKVLVVSKCDVLRKDIKFSKITSWLKNVYDIKDDIIYLSTNNNYGVNSIFNYLDKNKDNIAYILGITNAGKSTLINKLLKNYDINKEIVTSNKPNTTLDFIKINILDYIIYDTPGFTYPNQDLKVINKEVKPITYNVKRSTTFCLNDYKIYIDYPTSVTFYLINPNMIERKYEIFNGEALNIEDNMDLVISGMGFINIKKSGVVLVNKKNNIEIRNSISGDKFE